MALVMKARRAGGLHSLTSVTALGMAAPSPTPVMKRSAVSVVRSGEKAEARQAAPNTTTEPMSARRRPQRSASGPAIRAPAARPNSAALSTGARAGLATPQSCISEGAM